VSLHSLTTSLSRVLQSLRHLAQELNKPKAHWKQDPIVRKIERCLAAPFLAELIRINWNNATDIGIGIGICSSTSILPPCRSCSISAWGRTVLLTNRMDWSA
jgi:hypothetical protein